MNTEVCRFVQVSGSTLQRRALLSRLLLYCAVIGSLPVCVAFGLHAILNASAGLKHPPVRAATLLDLRAESAREIKRILAKPLPPRDPLPTITATARRVPSTVTAAKNGLVKLPAGAREVFARFDFVPSSRSSAMAVDRHAAQ